MNIFWLMVLLIAAYFLREFLKVNVTIVHAQNPVLLPVGGGRLAPLSDLINARLLPALRFYLPTPWLLSGHFQTVYAASFKYRDEEKVVYQRETIRLPDGGTVTQDWSPRIPTTLEEAQKPIVFITHGLTGGSYESYVESLVRYVVHDMGLVAVCQNFRGCADTQLTSPVCYSGGWTGDLALGIEHVRRKVLALRQEHGDKDDNVVLAGVGFSLGANIMLKYVGETGLACPLSCHVSVANPYDLLEGSRHMNNSWFLRNTYSRVMAGNLNAMLGKHIHHFHKAQYPFLDLAKVTSAQTIAEFDDNFTAPLFGFASTNEYYRYSSSVNFIHTVSIPTVLLHAMDDPVAPLTAVPVLEVTKNPFLSLVLTRHGGHLGWFRGLLTPHRWSTDAIAQVLGKLIPLPRKSGELARDVGDSVISVGAELAWTRVHEGRRRMGVPETYSEEMVGELRKRAGGEWTERGVQVVMERSKGVHGVRGKFVKEVEKGEKRRVGPMPELSAQFKADLEVAIASAKEKVGKQAVAAGAAVPVVEKANGHVAAAGKSKSVWPFDSRLRKRRDGRPASSLEMLRNAVTVGSLSVALWHLVGLGARS